MIQRAHKQSDSTVRSHLQALEISTRLTDYFRQHHQPKAVRVKPRRVIEVLNTAGVKPILMGTHGLNGWRDQARATQDVDLLVRKKDVRKASGALQGAYPKLIINDLPAVTRFIDPFNDLSVIDLMKPTEDGFRIVFAHTIPVEDTHEIPDLEMALASKFAAMVSPRRVQERKLQDGADFVNVVKHNRRDISLPKLRRLADKVYPNGGMEIMQLIEDIDAGRMIQL